MSKGTVTQADYHALQRHLATCSADKTVKVWSTENYEYRLERTLEGHQRWVWDAAFSADSAYLVTGS
jgi:G protein beta subunit-like protein